MYIYLAQVRENGIGVCGLETLLFFSLSFSLVCSPSPKSLPLLFYFFEAFLRRKTWGKRKFFFAIFPRRKKSEHVRRHFYFALLVPSVVVKK